MSWRLIAREIPFNRTPRLLLLNIRRSGAWAGTLSGLASYSRVSAVSQDMHSKIFSFKSFQHTTELRVSASAGARDSSPSSTALPQCQYPPIVNRKNGTNHVTDEGFGGLSRSTARLSETRSAAAFTESRARWA